MYSISWAVAPETELFWDVFSNIISALVAISVFGESISHIVPRRWLPSFVRPKERTDTIAKLSTWALVIALTLEVPIGIARDRIMATKSAMLAKHQKDTEVELRQEQVANRPRSISPDQRVAILRYLQNISPKEPVVVVWKIFDEEAEQFGRQILSGLKDAGFDATEDRGPFGFSSAGQWIVVRDPKKYTTGPSAVGAIQGAFRDILSIEFEGMQRDDSWPERYRDVVIAVGAKRR